MKLSKLLLDLIHFISFPVMFIKNIPTCTLQYLLYLHNFIKCKFILYCNKFHTDTYTGLYSELQNINSIFFSIKKEA